MGLTAIVGTMVTYLDNMLYSFGSYTKVFVLKFVLPQNKGIYRAIIQYGHTV